MALPHPKGEKLLITKNIDLPFNLFFSYTQIDVSRLVEDRDEALD
jgi:hypothetical protein